MDFVKDQIMQLILSNGQYIALGVAAVAGFVMLLGIAKKLTLAILAASLNGGEALARKLVEKPKAVVLAVSVFALMVLGLWAWHTFTAPKIVEKPVVETVTVRDESAIAEARGKYGQAENARSDAEARAAAAERSLAAVEQARKQAEALAAAQAAQLRELSPPEGDDKALERLKNQIDDLHADGVAKEAETLDDPPTRQVVVGRDDTFLGQNIYRTVPNPHANYRNYRKYGHKQFVRGYVPELKSDETFYHRSCSVCDQNFRTRVKMDEIYERLYRAERQRLAEQAMMRKVEREKRQVERKKKQEEDEKQKDDEEKARIAEKDRWHREVDEQHRQAIEQLRKQGTEFELTGHGLVPIKPPVKKAENTPKPSTKGAH